MCAVNIKIMMNNTAISYLLCAPGWLAVSALHQCFPTFSEKSMQGYPCVRQPMLSTSTLGDM
jgi:hypothetical protein